VTERAGHGFALSKAARERGASIIVAWGGDGTVNEVASALVHESAALAIVPAGSGNGLAQELQIDRRPEAAFGVALHSPGRRIDVGELGGRFFVNVAGIGFDAVVAREFNARPHRRGLLSYVVIVGKRIVSYDPAEYDIRLEHESIRCRAFIVALANSRQYGNGAKIAPQARIDDGKLDLVVAEASSALKSIWRARHLFRGTLARERSVKIRSVDHVQISCNRKILFHVDGETFEGGRILSGRVHRGALKVNAPTGRQ
jgi:diacylglycerol kinase (ATP)